ncbi:hypothetical protein [Symbiopectobacterium sp.]|uniref:hypothetical protein n=1 Tax=Symbiopectobacterium sp. TaxID=2952789 RepID=UPI003F3D1431
MKIYQQGRCHHSRLPADKHVSNGDINDIIIRLWRVKSMPDNPPVLRAERKKELESILKDTRRCLEIIINNPEKHNFSRHFAPDFPFFGTWRYSEVLNLLLLFADQSA